MVVCGENGYLSSGRGEKGKSLWQIEKHLCPLDFILRVLELICFQSRGMHMHVNQEVALTVQLDAAALVIH